ncbi:MAG: cation transporter [Verrucomicrobiales bacterium]|jgi:cation diffusion facilitator family transporter
MSNCHCHEEAEDITQKSVLLTLLLINGVMFCAELICGVIADSTGLVADSLDMLADATVYGIAFYAVGRANSVKISAARWSGYFQIALACGVFVEILRRLAFGSDPQSGFMLGVGLVALIANVTCLTILSKHRKGEVHMRASWIFSKNDVIANIGVILAGVLVYFTSSRWPDIVIGIIITIIVLCGGLAILREAAAEFP